VNWFFNNPQPRGLDGASAEYIFREETPTERRILAAFYAIPTIHTVKLNRSSIAHTRRSDIVSLVEKRHRAGLPRSVENRHR
jgi:hypothetical protein